MLWDLLSLEDNLLIFSYFHAHFHLIKSPSMILPSRNHRHVTAPYQSRWSNLISVVLKSFMKLAQYDIPTNPHGTTLRLFVDKACQSRYQRQAPRSYNRCMMAYVHSWIKRPELRRFVWRRGENGCIRSLACTKKLITDVLHTSNEVYLARIKCRGRDY